MKKIRRIIYLSLFPALSAILAGCGSTQITPAPVETPAEEPVKPAPVLPPEDDEYSKSVGNIEVSVDTFNADKTQILHIIDQLSTIMHDMDYASWILYVDEESREYWSKSANLKKAQSKLPVKGLQLKSLQDYFKYVFVPSRSGRSVSTIRYESDKYVKAVQITSPATADSEEKYTVYYYFNKIDGHWELHLPEIDG